MIITTVILKKTWLQLKNLPAGQSILTDWVATVEVAVASAVYPGPITAGTLAPAGQYTL